MVSDGEKTAGIVVGIAIPIAAFLVNRELSLFPMIVGAGLGALIWSGYLRLIWWRFLGWLVGLLFLGWRRG